MIDCFHHLPVCQVLSIWDDVASYTRGVAHGAHTGTPALMLMMLMDGAVVTSMQGALMLGFLDVLGSPGLSQTVHM